MTEPATAVVRERPLRVHTRNQLSDFDALVERALVAQAHCRSAAALLLAEEAVVIASELLHFETIHDVACALLKRRLATALAKVSDVQLEDGQRQAENAKRYLRRLVADADKRVPSFSGRPLW